ncbi:MAG: efflux RND transporter periplasmic adaptor subunit [Candidatus Erginobacter occultus]|nr:efflux RND transporter periplasmic adaptor subunit [Candidatus Erginobacter occultus]
MKERTNFTRGLTAVLAAAVLLAAGFILAGPAGAEPGGRQVYTCSMHPQVRSFDPDERCPICGMELIPVPMDEEDDPGEGELPRLRVSERAAALMEIRTRPVERREVEVELRLFGRVDFNESLLNDVVLFSPGYIESLKADYAGRAVKAGEPIAEIYSPEAVTAMEELLVARGSGGATLAAARGRLSRLGISPGQIEEILDSGEVPRTYRVLSPIDGVVQVLGGREGDRLGEGGLLARVADLSTVWIRFEAYETELAGVAAGQTVRFTLPAYPGESFEGEVVWVDPVLNEKTRTVGLRVEAANPAGRLKPGLFARGEISIPVSETAVFPDHGHPSAPLVIPATAPLFTGRRSLVYVRVPGAMQPTFEPREVLLGPRAGDYYVVREGLEEGEIVVVHGQFKIDSELQIRGRPSMMSPEGGPPPVHDHGGPAPGPDPAAPYPPAHSH